MRRQILALREAIRYHRAQISDYRCWVDDERLYKVARQEAGLPAVPAPEEFMRRCEAFWDRRQRPHEQGRGDPTLNSKDRTLDLPQYSNSDLDEQNMEQLSALLQALLSAISKHQQKGFRGRSVDDDEALYAILPEQVGWSSALPRREVFLANCARFCADCQKHPELILEWSQK